MFFTSARVGVFNKNVKRQRYLGHNGVYEKCDSLVRKSLPYGCSVMKGKPRSWERGGMRRNDQENWAESEE